MQISTIAGVVHVISVIPLLFVNSIAFWNTERQRCSREQGSYFRNAVHAAHFFGPTFPKLGAIRALYLGAPTRLCGYCQLDQQTVAGWTLIAIATGLGVIWFLAAFVGWPSVQQEDRRGPGLPRVPQAQVPA
jgi:hypothetical protein